MEPLKPLGKPLSCGSLPGADVPAQSSLGAAAVDQPISAFQWISLVRATWTWLLKPLWYITFKLPTQMLLYMRPSPQSTEDQRRRQADYYAQKQIEEYEEERRRDPDYLRRNGY
ncbi:hypothetical protein [Achromobacter sp.]|uniref:hypothetical protein n=1 Tax=Achromobacter sp. TaxID=134375 RepID=UPI002584E19A|nr:hypothetical protein [Achromobacter sp.]